MSKTTKEDVLRHKKYGSWKALDVLAQRMILDAQEKSGALMRPRLGGGTRLMLALEHRISHDIDLFIRDPQWIGYLSPRLNDRFDSELDGYEENAVSLKLKHQVGEIDFIVAMSLLGLPDEHSPETPFVLEPVAEVLAKKLFYRGWALTPRDLFDWWAINCHLPSAVPRDSLAKLLSTKYVEIRKSLNQLQTSATAKLVWGKIQAPEKPEIQSVIQWALSDISSLEKISGDSHTTSNKSNESDGSDDSDDSNGASKFEI